MVGMETPLVTPVHKEDNLKLVHFCEIQELYSLEEDIIVEFIIDRKIKASTFDWIGLFREDWNTFESFVTFQRGLGSPVNQETPRKRRVKFPYSKQLIDSILLDFRYQFVYVDKYLDILGMSSLFQFILPLKNYYSTERKVLPSGNQLTLAEELLISEGSHGGRSHLSSCRLHRNQLIKNTITTCNNCRPCGHDYYNIKQKAELCYFECMRLGERVSNLESEVAFLSLGLEKNNHNEPIRNEPKSNSSISLGTSFSRTESKDSGCCAKMINKTDLNQAKLSSDQFASNPSTIGKIFSDNSTESKLHSINIDDVQMNSKPNERMETDLNQMMIHSGIKYRGCQSKRENVYRTSSYPPDNTVSDCLNKYRAELSDVKKSSSDGKLANGSMALTDVDSPLILKAIIGHQEERIRKLTHLLSQHSGPEVMKDFSESLYQRDEDVVKLVRTEQRMLAQILRINNNCEEFSNESELAEKQKVDVYH